MIDQDREAFSSLIAEGIERYQHRIHAFCWMSNHVHLLIEVEERPLSDIIQNVSFRYTRYLNRRIKRMGHLFQGRYKALLVNEDQYLLELVRYIHLNPVRAGISKTADAFRWSGHHAYLGREKYFWLIQEEVLARISKRKGQARALYAQYISEGIGERRRAEFHRGGKEFGLLGDDAFIEKIRPSDETIKRNTVPTENLLKTVLEREGVSETEIRSASRTRKLALARQWLAYLSSEFGEENLTQLGQFLRRDVSTLSNGVRKIWTLTQTHSEWKQKSVRYQMQIMNNHLHLLVIPQHEKSLREGIGETHKRYSRLVNFREKVRGHLFQERFFSCPLDLAHLSAAARYVERNPVRAGICRHAKDFPWSSAPIASGDD